MKVKQKAKSKMGPQMGFLGLPWCFAVWLSEHVAISNCLGSRVL